MGESRVFMRIVFTGPALRSGRLRAANRSKRR